jgi:hypothetical protein
MDHAFRRVRCPPGNQELLLSRFLNGVGLFLCGRQALEEVVEATVGEAGQRAKGKRQEEQDDESGKLHDASPRV